MNTVKVAVPSNNPGGLDAVVSAHFGHCDLYTIVETGADGIKTVQTMDNPPHQQGGCLAPVQRLAAQGVSALLAGGMGQNPLAAFMRAGIRVYSTKGAASVGEAVQLYRQGKLPAFSADCICTGGTHCGQ